MVSTIQSVVNQIPVFQLEFAPRGEVWPLGVKTLCFSEQYRVLTRGDVRRGEHSPWDQSSRENFIPQVQTPVVKNCLLPKLCREDVDGDEEKSDREFGSEN
jgi:hypothetical protein